MNRRLGLEPTGGWLGRLARRVPAAAAVLAPDERPLDRCEDTWRASLKRRVIVLVALLGAWAIGLEARFFHLQVVQHAWLVEEAADRQRREIIDKAKRGEIVDRRGEILAYSVEADSIVAVPAEITDIDRTVDALCGAFDACTSEFRSALTQRLADPKFKAFTYIRRQVTPEEAVRVAALKLPGIGRRTETRRYYPKKELASHVVGFVSIDNQGLAGVERSYGSTIGGVDGKSVLQVDARGRSVQSRVELASREGATVELTIDQYLQHIAERELAAGVQQFNALGGTAIVMDPMTGEILADASYPTFNPNAPADSSPDARSNRSIQYAYEPGSTFKIVTASAAFDEGVFKVDDVVDTNPGVLKLPGRKPITEAKGHNYGALSFEQVIVKSSNVGAIKIGFGVGAARMERYIRRFGFGQTLLKRQLSGESAGDVSALNNMSQSALASMSMGYEVSVTPLQMVTAMSAVANGGTLFEPHLVRAVIQNGVRRAVAPKAVRQAITPETAATITSIMEQVVADPGGTGGKAKVDGYQVAGKTGTASKVVDGLYSRTDYNVSFAGFVPSRHPRFAILVVVDTPRGVPAYGGTVAAPIWQRIAEASLRQFGVPRTLNPVAPLLVAPAAAVLAPPAPQVVPVVEGGVGEPVVPDVRGLNAREAVRILSRAGLTSRVSGTGLVVAQSPDAGAPLERGGLIAVQLDRARKERE